MAPVECFCGCGRQVTGSDARISKKGAMVLSLREALEQYTLPMLEGDNPEIIATRENMQQLVSDGHLIESELAEIVHRERSARDFDNKGSKSWIKTSTGIVMQSMKTLEAEANRQGTSIYPDPR